MDITLDVIFLEAWVGHNIWWVTWQVFIYGGWVLFLIVFLWGGWQMWISHIRGKFLAAVKCVLLSIDVPKYNQQGPKAIEQLFAHLYSIKKKQDWIKRNIHGYIQVGISLELISIGGYIRFLIRTPIIFRDLVEAAVYAQYPDAEITETEDYVKDSPEQFPDERYQLWGSELILYNKQAYPIRTYPDFEDKTAREQFKDPMANLLEILGKIQKGEQVWTQILIVPAGNSWKKEAEAVIKKTTKPEEGPKKAKAEQLIGKMGDIVPTWGESIEARPEMTSLAAIFTPGVRRLLDAVQTKASKLGFKTKIRIIYFAPKEIFLKPRGVTGILGAFNQYSTLDMNGFKTDSLVKTKKKRWWGELRWPFWISPLKEFHRKQNKILINYKNRDNLAGSTRFILNTEELATLFHFPVATVEAPMVKKTGSRRAEPPFDLPVAEEEAPIAGKKPVSIAGKGAPPPELPTEE